MVRARVSPSRPQVRILCFLDENLKKLSFILLHVVTALSLKGIIMVFTNENWTIHRRMVSLIKSILFRKVLLQNV